jgi:hypothetical protein
MNTRHALPTAANDSNLIHSSTRTMLSTNADPAGRAPARMTLRTTRLEIRWLDGDVEIRFAAHVVNVSPKARSLPRRGVR